MPPCDCEIGLPLLDSRLLEGSFCTFALDIIKEKGLQLRLKVDSKLLLLVSCSIFSLCVGLLNFLVWCGREIFFFVAREAVRQAHLITFPAAFPNASPVWRPSEDRQAESEVAECQTKGTTFLEGWFIIIMLLSAP